jgi:hypothetical protein
LGNLSVSESNCLLADISTGVSRNAIRLPTMHDGLRHGTPLVQRIVMYKHVKFAAASAGALALFGMGAVAAVDGGVADATSSSSIGGAGATAVQETGVGSQPATSVVIFASPVVKAPPNGGGVVEPGMAVSP